MAGTGPVTIGRCRTRALCGLPDYRGSLGQGWLGGLGRASRALRWFATCSLGRCPGLRRRGVGSRRRICRSRRRYAVRCLPRASARRRRSPGTAGCAGGRWSAQSPPAFLISASGPRRSQGRITWLSPSAPSASIRAIDPHWVAAVRSAAARRLPLDGGGSSAGCMAKSAGAGAPSTKAAHMTGRTLEWMSYRGSGKLGDLPADLIGAANERRFIDDAVTLGHAEWTAPNAWRIAPPVLAGLRRDGEFAAVLCGARTSKLLDR